MWQKIKRKKNQPEMSAALVEDSQVQFNYCIFSWAPNGLLALC